MEQNNIGNRFIVLGFSCLLLSISFGLIASLQYVLPGFLADHLSFRTSRPLHVFLAVNWIFACVTGIIYNYLPLVAGRPLKAPSLAGWHFVLQLTTIAIAVTGFFTGHFSGREYLEFPAWVSLIIIGYWLLFVYNFMTTVRPDLRNAPVYIWSWCTGLVFFLITMTEAHLWLLPFFNHNVTRDITVQWKANGSMVGAWNMLIYGSSMFAMERISGNKEAAHSKTSFAFFFLGLTNLMFNWGHHTYIVPANPIVKEVSYIISMTELVLFANIIMKWRKGMTRDAENRYQLTPLFFKWADRWILLNLSLAIAISVPYINGFTHGTQITVAHAMGTTIGINSTLLLGGVAFLLERQLGAVAIKRIQQASTLMNVSLLVFWCSLLATGIVRSAGMMNGTNFATLSAQMLPYLRLFSASGIFLVAGMGSIIVIFLKPAITKH